MNEGETYLPVVLGYWERDGRVLLTRRPADTHQGTLWEFPGGKVTAGERLPDALVREMREELGIDVAVGEELAVTRYAYPEQRVELHLFRCRWVAGEPRPYAASELRWVAVGELDRYAFPPANGALLRQLRARFADSAKG